MRSIKFRAWHKEDGLMLDYLMLRQTAFNRDGVQILYDVLVGRKSLYSVMQYTGLKDKNGKEIYEGDVYRRYNYIYKVVWVQEKCCFMGLCFGRKKDFSEGFTKEHDGHLFPLADDGVMEVIGNVHENPELIKL